MEAGRKNKPSIGIRALPIFGPPANGNKSNSKEALFRPNWNSTGTIYYWSVILRSFCVVSNSTKRNANGFFKVLLLSLHLLILRHPVQKSKFGACALTGYCCFKSSFAGFSVPVVIKYTMPGLGMNFLFFFLSTPEQRTIFTVKKKTGHNVCLVKSWIPSSFVWEMQNSWPYSGHRPCP